MELDIQQLIGFLSLVGGFLVTLAKMLRMATDGQNSLLDIIKKLNSDMHDSNLSRAR